MVVSGYVDVHQVHLSAAAHLPKRNNQDRVGVRGLPWPAPGLHDHSIGDHNQISALQLAAECGEFPAGAPVAAEFFFESMYISNSSFGGAANRIDCWIALATDGLLRTGAKSNSCA
jgi:hypothetical protein